jgi:MFS family permease
MVADMWEPDEQQYAVCFVVLSSVGGSVIGPIIGGFVQAFLNWRWVVSSQQLTKGPSHQKLTIHPSPFLHNSSGSS